MKVKANTPLMQEIGSWFGRRGTTLWSVYEAEALEQVAPTGDDLRVVRLFYEAPDPKGELYRRQAVAALLNNWMSEVDKARKWEQASKPRFGGVY